MTPTLTNILQHLVSAGKTLSTAESCTSGRIAALLTSISGASNYFQGSLIAYQDWVKITHLGVSPQDIAQYDVVSPQVVTQMVQGACRLFHTDYAIATTGYAGSGTDRIPQGTIWIGFGTPADIHTICLTEDHGREANTQAAAQTALLEFEKYLLQNTKKTN